MKKHIQIILMFLIVSLFLSACGNDQNAKKLCWSCGKQVSTEATFCEHCGVRADDNEKQKYIGVWKSDYKDGYNNDSYMYVYEDETGDAYQFIQFILSPDKYDHCNSFTWKLEEKYFVKTYASGEVIKYTLDGDCLLDSQGKVIFRKYNNDPTVDILG